jgi:hypothetical protein
MSGKIIFKKTKALISLANSGNTRLMFNKTYTTETKEKINAIQNTTIFVYDLQGSLVNIFSFTRKTAEYFNISHITILIFFILLL